MKKSIIIFISIFVGLLIGAGVLYYVGNMPEKTYYPDGRLKSITQRKFFKKNGDYTILNQNGAISQKYTLVNGIKNAKAYVYTTGKPTEFTYNNGVLQGVVIIDKNKLSPLFESFEVNIKPQNIVEIKSATKDAKFDSLAKLMCNDEDLINKFQQFDLNPSAQTVKDFFGCFSYTKIDITSSYVKCTIEGDYQYPKFKADTKFACQSQVQDEQAVPYMEQMKVEMLYDVKKGSLNTTSVLSDTQYGKSSFKGMEEIIESITEYTYSKQTDADMGKLLSSVIENFTISDMEISDTKQKIMSVEGDFNIVNGFSNPYTISYFTKKDVTTKIQITDKGISLKSRYPLSKKPMMALEINVNDVIKEKYSTVIKALTTELSKNINVPETALFSIMSQWTDYAWQFSDVIKSVGGAVWNNKGQKVMVVQATVKNNINIETFFEDMAKYIDIKIIAYKNGKANKIATGNLAEGFTINGKAATEDDVIDLLLNPEMEKTFEEIKAELDKTFADVNMDVSIGSIPATDPFLLGLYSGYTKAMETYRQNRTQEQFFNMISNIKAMFGDVKNYKELTDKTAVWVGDGSMIIEDTEGVKLKNAFDGNVIAKGSKLFADDEEYKAFVVEFDGLDKQTCISLASNSLLLNPLAVAVGNIKTSGTSETYGIVGTMVDEVYKDSKDMSVITNEGIAFSINQGIPYSYALAACNGETNTNSIAIKLY